MKKNSNSMNGMIGKHSLVLWFSFHLFVILFFLVKLIFVGGHYSIDADLFNITPRNFDSAPISKADELLTSKTGNNVFILVSNPDFESAKNTATIVYDKLKDSDNFTSVSLNNDLSSYSNITDFLFKYRWNMLDEKSIELINSSGGAETFAKNSIAKIFGLFTLTSLDNIEEDPFMLTENNLENYLLALQNSGTAMSIKDGMLASQYEQNWYIMIRGELSKKGAAMATKKNAVNEIYSVCLPLENETTKFIFSGTPYHSNESSMAASKEISIISIISLIAVLFILLIVFRSPVPILCSVLSMGLSVLTAFLITMAVFNKIMILTLVFGTSLIGSSIDYSLHYFTHWAGNPELKSTVEIRNHLSSGLTMAIVSSGICYAILLFAPFQLLKQISLFSLAGLFSSFLTTISIYPLISLPKGNRNLKIKILYKKSSTSNFKSICKKIIILLIAIASITTIFICKKYFGIENDISKLYSMEGRLLNDEINAGKIIQYSPTGWFLISGDSENDVLINEENFRKKFASVTDSSGKYLSPTIFIPSVESQKKSRQACKKLLEISDEQFTELDLDTSLSKNLYEEFQKTENDFISFENDNIPKYLMDSISNVYLGKINDKYYSVLVPNLTLDEKLFSEIAAQDENVYFISKRNDISSSLDRLTKMVLLFFGIAYIIMFVVLKLFYPLKNVLKIISVPLLVTLSTAAVFSFTKTKLEFFSVTGLILVFGLGLDYVIYMIENEKNKNVSSQKLEPFATSLSFATTLLSFGALALSSFTPVHLIGLAISIGLTTAFVCSKCFEK